MIVFDHRRIDERKTFVRARDRAPVIWKAAVTSALYHATADGRVAVCAPRIRVGDHEPWPRTFPSTMDRSNDTMTCCRCEAMVLLVPQARAG